MSIRFKFLISVFALFCLFLLNCRGPARTTSLKPSAEEIEAKEWAETEEEDTYSKYENFVKKYPAGKHTHTAKEHLGKLSIVVNKLDNQIKEALEKGDIETLTGYLDFRSDGPLYFKVLEELENRLSASIASNGAQKRAILPGIAPTNEKATRLTILNASVRWRGFRVLQLGHFNNLLYYGDLGYHCQTINDYYPPVPWDFRKGPIAAPKISKGKGSIHRYVYEVDFFGVKFNGDPKHPLTFAMFPEGYVYLHGNGSVMLQDGKRMIFGLGFPRQKLRG